MKIHPVGAEFSIWTDEQKEGQTETMKLIVALSQ